MSNYMKIVLTGGGTGGHIFPLISIAREIKNIQTSSEIFYIGPKDPFARGAFNKENIPVKIISSGKIRRYFSFGTIFQNIIDIFIKIPFGFLESLIYLQKIKPESILSKGGYGTIPVVFAGKLLGIPIFLHESDSIAGLANKITGRFARTIFVSFPIEQIKNLPQNKLVFTGNPIRESILSGNLEDAKKIFNLQGIKPILLVLGGSQGSMRINTIILENRDYLLEKFEIIHQTGRIDYNRVIKEKNENYHVYDFLNEEAMANALFCCACIISRAGSGSISEISAVGKPSILIPLPEAAQNHQIHNASIYEKYGACISIKEEDFTKERLFNALENILKPENKESFCNAAKNFSKINAAKTIAKKVLEENNFV